MSFIATEIASQPGAWAHAVRLAATPGAQAALPAAGERVAVVGCGTSLFMAQAFACLRESAALGETDAFPASEFPFSRGYDRLVALTRSGTTTEVTRLLRRLPATQRSTVITADPSQPAATLATHQIVLDFADEKSVVQTRFATTALALWRAGMGMSLDRAIADATADLAADLDPALLTREHFVFLGTGWTIGLANEAALKLREAAQAWTESYPAMEFRHGPISVLDNRSVVCVFGPVPDGLRDDIAATGATFLHSETDPMAQLTTVQRLAAALAAGRGLDPDRPRHLTRSIILPASAG